MDYEKTGRAEHQAETRIGFPSPARNGGANGVVRLRETWCANEHGFEQSQMNDG